MALSAADVSTMYAVLVNSLSADEAARRPAEAALAQCETRPGFCSCLLVTHSTATPAHRILGSPRDWPLASDCPIYGASHLILHLAASQEIISSRGLACREDVRLLATVYFKNSIHRYWRHRRDSYGISNEEKDHLRKNLLLNIREENSQIALQLAVLISKIARLDYPKEWPDLLSVLAQQLQSADVLASHRVFMVLFRTLKELSTKRLAVDQKNYAECIESSQFLCRYFIYTAKDLEEWSENPESFHHEQNLVQWTEKKRPCAEALFIVIFEKYRELLAPVVVSVLREAMAVSPPQETDVTAGMLLKDAAYTAAGHVYYELSNYLNFNEWFHGSLSIEVSNHHPNMRIIRRKIALLLGQWISEIKGDTRKLVYRALVGLLQDNDIAVRVQVLNFISVLLEHAGDKIIPFASQLSQFFQMLVNLVFFFQIWDESTGESLLQIQLLTALRTFVSSLGFQSPLSYHVLIPILQSGINIDSPDALNLLEDSVLLWESTLSNAPSIVPQLLDLFPYLVGIVNRSFDHLEVTIKIIEDYTIFGGSEFLKSHGASLAGIIDTIVGNVNDKGLLAALPIVDLLIQIFPLEAPPLISSALQKLIFISLSQDDGQNPSRTTVRASSGAILARLLVMNTNFSAQLLSEPALLSSIQQAGIAVNNNMLISLVDMWIDKVDDANAVQQKEYAMALSVVLTLQVPQVIDRLDDILSVCTTVIIGSREVKTDDDTSGDITSASWMGNDGSGYSNTSSKELRKRQVKDSDPIKQASLENVLRENLKACAAFHGDAAFNAAISRIHPSAFAQLQQALNTS
nr:unnamed protein product [Digitaria exilis]